MVSCILLRTTCEEDVRTLGVLSCMWITASNEFGCFLVWPLPEPAMGILRSRLLGAAPICALRDVTTLARKGFPLCTVSSTSTSISVTAKK